MGAFLVRGIAPCFCAYALEYLVDKKELDDIVIPAGKQSIVFISY